MSARIAPALERTAIHLTLLAGAAIVLFPLVWTFVTSITPEDKLYAWPPRLVPEEPTLEHYRTAVVRNDLVTLFKNTFIVSIGTVVLSLAVGSLAAYRFARARFAGRTLMLFLLIASLMIPGLTNLVPLYLIMSEMRLLNSHLGLILVLTAANMPLVVWLLKGFIEAIPVELDESAMIDGATRFQVFRLVILPLIVPGMAAAAVLVFIAAWNEFLLALILIQDPARRVIQPAINLLVGSDTHTPWHIVSATTLIACVPVCIIFVFLQKYLVSGLTAGAIKG